MPDEGLREMKGKQNQPVFNLLTTSTPCGVSAVIKCSRIKYKGKKLLL